MKSEIRILQEYQSAAFIFCALNIFKYHKAFKNKYLRALFLLNLFLTDTILVWFLYCWKEEN